MQSGNPDIRAEVDKSRGLLKKIQLHIPGYRGYRRLEDLRVADELLRKQTSDILQQALNSLQNERLRLVNSAEFDKLTIIGSAVSKVQEFQGELLHAQQGYSGISATIRVDETKLSDLYDYDLKFLDISANIRDLSDFTSSEDVAEKIEKLSEAVSGAKLVWDARISAIEKILLTPSGDK